MKKPCSAPLPHSSALLPAPFKNLENMHIILASNSPRRRELLGGLGISFEVKVLPDIDEDYPATLPTNQIAEYIACKKADAYREIFGPADLVITADTIVVAGGEVMGKPTDADDARRMLRKLSGQTHQVVTGVCLTAKNKQSRFSVTTDVDFKQLSEEEINYYIDTYRPFDKAGAYGIQEWIGFVGVTGIKGSYFNVMGLPVQRIYEELRQF